MEVTPGNTHSAQLIQSESPEEEVGDALGGGRNKVLKERRHLVCGEKCATQWQKSAVWHKHTRSSTSTAMASTWVSPLPKRMPIGSSHHAAGAGNGPWRPPGVPAPTGGVRCCCHYQITRTPNLALLSHTHISKVTSSILSSRFTKTNVSLEFFKL